MLDLKHGGRQPQHDAHDDDDDDDDDNDNDNDNGNDVDDDDDDTDDHEEEEEEEEGEDCDDYGAEDDGEGKQTYDQLALLTKDPKVKGIRRYNVPPMIHISNAFPLVNEHGKETYFNAF